MKLYKALRGIVFGLCSATASIFTCYGSINYNKNNPILANSLFYFYKFDTKPYQCFLYSSTFILCHHHLVERLVFPIGDS